MTEPVGAVDIGTNSCRLLVQAGGRDLERRADITRLGRDVGRTGVLAPSAVDATLAMLATYRARLDELGAARVRAVATSAVRDARNRDDFLAAAGEVLGVPAEVLSGDEEGHLAFRGAVSGLAPADGPFLVVDIGGGSTELVVGRGDVEGAVSLDVGAVRLTEAYLHHDPPRPEELTNAIGAAADALDDALRAVPAIEDARTVIGVAGTITTVAAVELGLQVYDRDRIHRFELTRVAAEDVFRTLATEALADRVHNPGLQTERADIIVGGCCVLVAVLRNLHLSSILVSEHDLLDGIAAGLLP